MDFLDRTFEGRVLALGADQKRRRGHSWAPRSPDITVPDFGVWPILKQKVFLHPRPETLEALEERILSEIHALNANSELIKKCHVGVRNCAQMCFENFGGHFEFLK